MVGFHATNKQAIAMAAPLVTSNSDSMTDSDDFGDCWGSGGADTPGPMGDCAIPFMIRWVSTPVRSDAFGGPDVILERKQRLEDRILVRELLLSSVPAEQ